MSKLLLFANTDWFLFNFRLHSAQACRDRGDEVLLVSPGGRYAAQLRQPGFRWIEIPLQRRGANPLTEAGAILQLARLYRAERPDLVHHFTVKCVLYGTIAARLAGVRTVVNSLTGLGYAFLGRRRLLRGLVGLAYRLLLRTTGTIFENPADQALFLELGWINAERSAVILGAGVDLDRFRPSPEPTANPPLIVFPARLLWDKGAAEFVEAARILRQQGVQARFALVGEADPGNPTGIPQATLEQWMREGLVEQWGWREDMEAVYAEAHIISLPSYREGLSRTLIEAAASGRAIVTTDVPGCREVVVHGVNGFLVPPRDARALAEALHTLIDDADLRGRMGKNGRVRAEQHFSLNKITNETLACYSRWIAGASR